MRGRDILDHFALAHAEAVALSGEHRVRLQLAGRTLSLVFAGQALAALVSRAFRHLPVLPESEAAADLEIRVFDSRFSGVAPPIRPWEDEVCGPRYELLGSEPDGTRMTYTAEPAAFSVYDPSRRLAVHWSADGEDYPLLALASPFHFVLCWWAEACGAVVVHSAAVGRDGKGLLLAGRGGSGKSSTALGCLERGLSYAGDDAVWCDVQADPVIGWPLYATARVNAEDLQRFPRLAETAAPEGRKGEKRVLFLGEHFTAQIAPLTLSALYLPVLGSEAETRVESASRTDALRALIPWTLDFHPHSGPRTLFLVMLLIQRLPKVRLILGTDREAALDTLASILEGR